MSQIQQIPESLSQPGSAGIPREAEPRPAPHGCRSAPGVSLGYFWDISVLPWGSSALGAWGGVAGPPPIQSLLMWIPGKGHKAQLQLIHHLCSAGTAQLGIFPIFFKRKRGEEGAVEGIQALPAPAPGCSREISFPSAPSRCGNTDADPGAVLGLSRQDGWQGGKRKVTEKSGGFSKLPNSSLKMGRVG